MEQVWFSSLSAEGPFCGDRLLRECLFLKETHAEKPVVTSTAQLAVVTKKPRINDKKWDEEIFTHDGIRTLELRVAKIRETRCYRMSYRSFPKGKGNRTLL